MGSPFRTGPGGPEGCKYRERRPRNYHLRGEDRTFSVPSKEGLEDPHPTFPVTVSPEDRNGCGSDTSASSRLAVRQGPNRSEPGHSRGSFLDLETALHSLKKTRLRRSTDRKQRFDTLVLGKETTSGERPANSCLDSVEQVSDLL